MSRCSTEFGARRSQAFRIVLRHGDGNTQPFRVPDEAAAVGDHVILSLHVGSKFFLHIDDDELSSGARSRHDGSFLERYWNWE